MATDPEGRIDVRLERRGDRVEAVDIRSSRPQLAPRLMAGRTPEEAADLAGLLFSLCGRAQRAAARAACAAARGETDQSGHSADGEDGLQVRMELAREHAWRLLLDWPQTVGQKPNLASLLALRQAPPEGFADTLEGLLRNEFLGEAPAIWLARDLDGLDAWRSEGGNPGATLPARLFGQLDEGPDPGLSSAELLPVLADWNGEMAEALGSRALEDPPFCARPDWHGTPAETGAIAPMRNHPMLAAWLARRGRGMGARMLARLLELAALPDQLRQGDIPLIRAWSFGEDKGIAGVETSRGLLFHVARLEGGRVADYRILAPTEWNFHPAGPLFQALRGLAAGKDLERLARLVTRSLDPCVGFGIEVR